MCRTMGEYEYRDHLMTQFRRADKRLVLGCIWAQALLYVITLMLGPSQEAPTGIALALI